MAGLNTTSRPTSSSLSGEWTPKPSQQLIKVPEQDALPLVPPQGQDPNQHYAVLPGGQTISMVTNNNVHLPFKDWFIRGIVSAFGNMFAFPFRVIGNAINKVVEGAIGIVKIAIIMVLAPTLIWLGIQLLGDMREQDSIESGTAEIVKKAGQVTTGIGRGLEGEPAKTDQPAKAN